MYLTQFLSSSGPLGDAGDERWCHDGEAQLWRTQDHPPVQHSPPENWGRGTTKPVFLCLSAVGVCVCVCVCVCTIDMEKKFTVVVSFYWDNILLLRHSAASGGSHWAELVAELRRSHCPCKSDNHGRTTHTHTHTREWCMLRVFLRRADMRVLSLFVLSLRHQQQILI